MAVNPTPGYQLTPSAEQVTLSSNYITDFDFLNQYLPDTYNSEFARYGDRSVASFLRMVSAELPSESDLIKWEEQGRLHIKYVDCASDQSSGQDTAQITISDAGATTAAIRVGQTVMIYDTAGATGLYNKAIVTAVSGLTFDVAYYEAGGQTFESTDTLAVFIYGSEFKKGTNGMAGALEAEPDIFDNKPIILKDKYEVSGSDMAQIGWVQIDSDEGPTYLWYLKSKGETRQRFDDYLETSILEAVPAETGSGAIAATGDVGNEGAYGVFYTISDRGNVFNGSPATLAEWDTIIQRLDKQGAIEENVVFVDRATSFGIDDMLASQNSYAAGGTSYGLFDNNETMALNLGFTGFRRGYDFYKSDWKYLNDPTMRGGMPDDTGKIHGLLAPAGTTNVYDQVMGQNAKRPFLHVRYRKSQNENRRYKTWITGSAGGANTSDKDVMEVNFLSERIGCVLGANNFFIFEA